LIKFRSGVWIAYTQEQLHMTPTRLFHGTEESQTHTCKKGPIDVSVVCHTEQLWPVGICGRRSPHDVSELAAMTPCADDDDLRWLNDASLG
jgi:hypothetical protein